MKKRMLALCALVLSCAIHARADESNVVSSPNGAVEIRFYLIESQPYYELQRGGRTIIARSPLGLNILDGQDFRALEQIGAARVSVDERYALHAGKTSEARNHYNQATFLLQETDGAGRRIEIVLRAYDDGAAFRYVLPAQPGVTTLRLWNERTQFNFPVDYQCWGYNVGAFGSNHEGEFDPVPAARIRPHNMYDMPLVCSDADVAFAIAEADLENYAGLYLTGRGDGGLGVAARLSQRVDGVGGAVLWDLDEDGLKTPWCAVMLADSPGRLIESNLIANLSPPPAFDASWVRPGRSAWDWWSGSQAATDTPVMTTQSIRAYVDFAAANNIEYMLVDDGWFRGANAWTPAPDADITQPIAQLDLPWLISYARERNVRIWLWVHWRLLDARMEEAMQTYRRWGVAGIKVDYMDRDDQEIVDFYHRLLRTAAENRLMVNLHGAYPPRGLARTFPNFLTQEGVLGAEYNKWSRRVTSGHNVMLAYTRMLIGPMDYTPGGMRNVVPDAFEPRMIRPQVMHTRAHGLAMYVVYDSPFAVIADDPDAYAGQDGLDFLRAVPATWDETRFISGEIGEYVVVARRRGREWYVGVMTNETARDVEIPLSFLAAGRHRAEIWADGEAITSLTKSEARLTADDVIRLHLAANGGAAVRIRR